MLDRDFIKHRTAKLIAAAARHAAEEQKAHAVKEAASKAAR